MCFLSFSWYNLFAILMFVTRFYDIYQVKGFCHQCFDAVGWAAGRASEACKKLSDGMLAWLSVLSGARCRLAYGPADATATHCLLLQ